VTAPPELPRKLFRCRHESPVCPPRHSVHLPRHSVHSRRHPVCPSPTDTSSIVITSICCPIADCKSSCCIEASILRNICQRSCLSWIGRWSPIAAQHHAYRRKRRLVESFTHGVWGSMPLPWKPSPATCIPNLGRVTCFGQALRIQSSRLVPQRFAYVVRYPSKCSAGESPVENLPREIRPVGSKRFGIVYMSLLPSLAFFNRMLVR